MAQPLTDSILALTRYANETTGADDPDLSSAVRTLCDGYGQGIGGDDWLKRDGKTHLHIDIPTNPLLDVILTIWQEKANGITIDWGDGSPTEIPSSSGVNLLPHTYSAKGEYEITITRNTGTFATSSTSSTGRMIFSPSNTQYRNSPNCILLKAEIGDGFNFTKGFLFAGCYNLTDVIVTGDATKDHFGSRALEGTLVTEIDLDGFTGYNSYSFSITKIRKHEMISGVTSTAYGIFSGCQTLSELTLKEGLQTITTASFSGCWSLTEVTIPSTVTRIEAQAFQNCSGFGDIHLLPTTPPTLANANAFGGLTTGNAPTPRFLVPYSEDHSILEAYKTASNWSTYAQYMEEEGE